MLKEIVYIYFKMRVVVVYSGALRTIRKTMRYFKQNVLIGSHVQVFACIQNDTSLPNSEWEEWIRAEMGDNLKYLIWFNLAEHSDWVSLRNKNVEALLISDTWKDYLKTSGSIIEYLQLQITYQAMFQFEQRNGFLYDYIIRCRTDNMFAKPIDFHWLNWSNGIVSRRIDAIKEKFNAHSIEATNDNVLKYFMNTLIDDSLINNIGNIISNCYKSRTENTTINPNELNNYIKNGSYILAFRANNLYIVRRDLFYLIPSLATFYGFVKSPYSDNYWFNAENQFQAACYHSGLTIYDYNTLFEDRSLYEYDEKRYFDENYNIINPFMLYCLVRN